MESIVNLINVTAPSASWIASIMIWLVGICGSIAGGIVLFTLMLKLITLPFDYFSRASMRKNSLKMEEMRPELEKLQKQYAGDKLLYNKKMMALYKKNGYSMFGACLPTILTLVIFIIAMTGFSNYSKYQNVKYFEEMSIAYNQVVLSGIETDEEYIIRNEDGSITLDCEKLFNVTNSVKIEDKHSITVTKGQKEIQIPDDISTEDVDESAVEILTYFDISTTNGFIKLRQHYEYKDGKNEYGSIEYFVVGEKLSDENTINLLASEENNYLKNYEEKTFNEYVSIESENSSSIVNRQLEVEFIKDIQQTMSAKKFRESNTQFLWVKNIWVQDKATAHPVDDEASSFNSTNSCSINETEYNELVNKLDDEKDAANGYYILVVLTAGISLLMQWLSSRSQKAQMELQSVDGKGMQQQKIMMWMMPIMMAVFSFLYTAAFSLYMILSSAISILTMLGINWIVDKRYKKKKETTAGTTEVVHGRVYVDKTPKEEPKKEKKTKKNKEPETGDFITGKKKHIRGRLK